VCSTGQVTEFRHNLKFALLQQSLPCASFLAVVVSLNPEIIARVVEVVSDVGLLVLIHSVGSAGQGEDSVVVVGIDEWLAVVRVVYCVILLEEFHHQVLDLVVGEV